MFFLKFKDVMNYRKQLREQGYVVVPDVLTTDEVSEAKRAFYEWKSCMFV